MARREDRDRRADDEHVNSELDRLAVDVERARGNAAQVPSFQPAFRHLLDFRRLSMRPCSTSAEVAALLARSTTSARTNIPGFEWRACSVQRGAKRKMARSLIEV